jgi:hypothetical protein
LTSPAAEAETLLKELALLLPVPPKRAVLLAALKDVSEE